MNIIWSWVKDWEFYEALFGYYEGWLKGNFGCMSGDQIRQIVEIDEDHIRRPIIIWLSSLGTYVKTLSSLSYCFRWD